MYTLLASSRALCRAFPFIVIASLLMGCASSMTATHSVFPSDSTTSAASTTSPGLDTLVGSQWIAKAMANPALPGRTTPRLQFISLTQIGGNAGCNSFGGDALISGDNLRMGPLGATKKMCESSAMATETKFLAALESVRRARIVRSAIDTQLEMSDETGTVVLRLTRSE